MKKGSKIVSILIVLTFCLSFFVGCTNSNGQSSRVGTITKEELSVEKIGDYGDLKLPLTNKATKLSIMVTTNLTDLDSSTVITELRRRTGIDLDVLELASSTINEKSKILMASKSDMPDIFYSGSMPLDEINDYGMMGGFEPIDDHIDELPNFKDIFVTNAQANKTEMPIKNLRAADGKLYMFPRYDSERDVNHGMLYRKDIFDKNNIPMWNNKEEFYQAMKKLKGIYPKSKPFVSKTQTTFFNQLGQSWGILFPNPYFDEELKIWKHSVTDPKLKDMLEYIKKMYDEGLLDKEFITATQASWTSLMTQKEAAFATFDWIGRMDMFKEQTKNTIPEYDLRYGNPIGPTGKVITLSKVGPGPSFKKTPNSELAMKLCDYLISPSGAELITLGIKDVTYTIGEDGFADYIGMDNSKPIGINELEEKYGMFSSGIYRRFDKRSTYFNYSQKEKEAQDLMLNKENGGFLAEDPLPILNQTEKEIKSKYQTQLKKASEEFVTKYIISNENGDDAWNNWVKKANEMGAQEIADAYNSAQKRYDQL